MNAGAGRPPALEAAAATVADDHEVSRHLQGERCDLVARLTDPQFGDRLKPELLEPGDPGLEDCSVCLSILGDHPGECTFSKQHPGGFGQHGQEVDARLSLLCQDRPLSRSAVRPSTDPS